MSIIVDMDAEVDTAKDTGFLRLSFLQLSAIPSAIFDVKTLVQLDLGHNELVTIPSTIGLFVRQVQHGRMIFCILMMILAVSFTTSEALLDQSHSISYLHTGLQLGGVMVK